MPLAPKDPRPLARPARLGGRRAFTLTELLIVISIIVLVTALGVPVFNSLRGARSVEAGINQVSAVVGQARTVAVNEGVYCGVIFFINPATPDRTSMALITIQDPNSDPDPYDKYKSWFLLPGTTPNNEYQVGNVTLNPPTLGEKVVGMTVDAAGPGGAAPINPSNFADPANVTGAPSHMRAQQSAWYRPVVRTWSARARSVPNLRDPGDASGNGPRVVSANSANEGRFDNAFWAANASGVSLYSGGDFVTLPVGVGSQVIVQPLATTFGSENYVQLGAIVFDPTGKMSFRTLSIAASSTLGQALQLAADLDGIPSGVGLAVYDRPQFDSQNFSLTDGYVPANRLNATAQSLLRTGDRSIPDKDEAAQSAWLDSNATPFFVNRFSGVVTQGN
jgi:prepilin-type N-terminal cleavage/methylation domain-containing protein